MYPSQPVQLSLLPAALQAVGTEQQLVGLWLGGERWLPLGDRLVSAFVFFHFQDGGGAVVSIRSEDERLPTRVYGRWWIEGSELVVALGEGVIRAPFTVSEGVLTWADEVLVRRAAGRRTSTPAEPSVATEAELPNALVTE